jgi:Glycosyltransferase family 9 (heptosyltransferase)
MLHDGIDGRIFELNLKASQFQARGDFEAARAHYMAALLWNANQPDVLGNLAGVLYKLQKHEMGIATGLRAVRINPNDFMIRNNLAINLISVGRVEEARAHLKVATTLKPDDPAMLHTKGSMFCCENKFDLAEKCFRRAREVGYDCYVTQNDQALAGMAQGQLTENLELYEVRWEELYKNAVWDLGIPEWKGEVLEGKSIIIHKEQGFGDEIMLVRFVKKFVEMGANPALAVSKPLERLLAENFPDIPVFNCDSPAAELREYDYHTPMLSMIRHLGITPRTINSNHYLSAREPLTRPIPGRLKVGLCWASGDHGDELKLRRRIVDLASLLPLCGIPGVQVVSLQKDENQKQLYALGAEALIIDTMSRVADFYDTARLIHQLDLVVSVDSAVAHLAGAMGKPTIVLGPRRRCWRWWNQPSGEPWYKNMKIYTQDEKLSWEPAVRRVVRDVENLVSKGVK